VTQNASVHTIVPLALLEAIRNLDTPLDDGLAGLVIETATRRLGTSSTVAAQIDRYREASSRGGRIGIEEASQVFRLAGRRSDANLVYADAGRRAARLAARRTRVNGGLKWLLPKKTRRRLGENNAIRIARRVFGLELVRASGALELRLRHSLATESGFAGTGCLFYGSLLAELLRVTSGFEGAMVHERCRTKDDDECLWRMAEAEEWK